MQCSKWLALVCATIVALTESVVAASPHTAQLTDVADAAEPDNPFDFNASVGFRRTVRRARITREAFVDGQATFADELTMNQVTQALDIRAQIALYHDLEFNFYMPYVFNQDADWDFRVPRELSTIVTDPTLGTALFDVPYRSYKRGLQSLDFGLAWSPFNDQRDDTKPTWTIRFTYSFPVGAAFAPIRDGADPVADAALAQDVANGRDPNNPAAVGDKVHRLRFETSFSKRFLVFDPYVTLSYTHAIADRAGITGHTPPLTGGFTTGIEIIPWDTPAERQRLSFDLRLSASFVGPGRTYSELTDPLRQLTYVDNYATLTAGAYLVFQPIQYVRLSAGISVGHDTQHLITNENPGNPGADGVVDLNDPNERNPNYRGELDSPGRRFRVEDTTIFTWYVSLQLML
ncbi:MAG: hypothetical protein IT381_01140 [Deltaproteobacteria bacterium]|nr:hypothetical protein [Deltaproteobacteria bacterium]